MISKFTASLQPLGDSADNALMEEPFLKINSVLVVATSSLSSVTNPGIASYIAKVRSIKVLLSTPRELSTRTRR